jgi:hypothetical protein
MHTWSQDRPRTSSRLRCNRFMKSPDSVYPFLQKERGARQDYRKTRLEKDDEEPLCKSRLCMRTMAVYGVSSAIVF